ncbi:MAG: acetyl-CoA carboxylase carboxyltransferase subunit alpha [Phycisphaeraceae bacterium]|nr:acetyl-CoA carboxylase carboxyltransferase subunit alpha [Phycisphaeraceae bacterium]
MKPMTALNSYTGTYELEFERPLIQLEKQIAELETHADEQGVDIAADLRKLRQSHTGMLKKIYAQLTPWHTVKVARHPGRPQAVDYIRAFVKDFCELHGDRHFGDDPAIITGLGRIGSQKCLIVAHNKGKDTKERIACNFGMAHPEGYRKALAKMKLAEKFGLPVVTLVDTAGAYPGIGAEERGQAEAIAVNLREMSRLRVPIVSVVVGEGGSGGALGIAVADRVGMMQYAWYSVISPEGCASILWKTGEAASQAAESLKLTAQDNLRLGTVEDVIEEPLGGAHRNPDAAADKLEKWIIQSLRDLTKLKSDTLLKKRFERLRDMGQFEES